MEGKGDFEGKFHDEPQFSVDGCVNTKGIRTQQFLTRAAHEAPVSFTGNSEKEELCLEYVENFRRQFIEIFPDRRPLLLSPTNECGVRKFVCTTIRPTQLPYKNLYDAAECARFIADFLRFEPLEDPYRLPACLASPFSTLRWGVGDCFDLSTVLCSFLIGSGYNAFVVSGQAPQWVSLHDQTETRCPIQVDATTKKAEGMVAGGRGGDDAAAPREEKTAGESHYDFSARGPPKSTFLEAHEKKAQDLAAKGRHVDPSDDDPPVVGAGDEKERRIHAWVLVRFNKRDVENDFFIEPSTGRCYPTAASPYLGIDSIWNNQNYWVNMQTEKPVERLSYDLSNTDNWEFVFIDTMGSSGSGGDGGDGDEFSGEPAGAAGAEGAEKTRDDEGDGGRGEQILGIPASWVPKLLVARADYMRRFHDGGRKTTYYWKAKHEEYAPHVHPEGIVSRLTIYSDRTRTVTREIQETFADRRDKLQRRIRRPLDRRVHEFYLPGRQLGLREYIDTMGKEREMHFYLSARLDGLVLRKEILGEKVLEYFEERDDCMSYRSVTVEKGPSRESRSLTTYVLPCGQLGDLIIAKMAKKFERNQDKAAEEDVSKMTFYVRDGRVRSKYHRAVGRITASQRVYDKDSGTVDVNEVDPFTAVPSAAALAKELQQVRIAEKDCYAEVRNAERETVEILDQRRREERDVVLEKSVFETAREKSKEDTAAAEANVEEEEVKDERQVDYLTPFLQDVRDSKNITRDEAARAMTECLTALKERLVERANIIQKRLDEENAALAKKQNAFQRTRDHTEGADEEFEKYCSQAMFRIQILEQRLSRHSETALQKYADVDQKLRNDPRLAVLNA